MFHVCDCMHAELQTVPEVQVNRLGLWRPCHAVGLTPVRAHTQTGSPSVSHSLTGFNVYYHGECSYPI